MPWPISGYRRSSRNSCCSWSAISTSSGGNIAWLRVAMRVRCFRPTMSRHTYRAFGYLVGMLLVREFRPQRACPGSDEMPGIPRPLLPAGPLCLRTPSRPALLCCGNPPATILLGLEWICSDRLSSLRDVDFSYGSGRQVLAEGNFCLRARPATGPPAAPTAAARPRSCT